MKTIELNSKEIKYLKKVIKTTGHFVFKGEKELGNNLIDKLNEALTIHDVVQQSEQLVCDDKCEWTRYPKNGIWYDGCVKCGKEVAN